MVDIMVHVTPMESDMAGAAQESAQPSLLARAAQLETKELLALVRTDQFLRWQRGEKRLVETYLTEIPALRDEVAVILDLVRTEILLRLAQVEHPRREEYAQRFPQYADAIAEQFRWVERLRPGQTAPETPSLDRANTVAQGPPQVAEIEALLSTSNPARLLRASEETTSLAVTPQLNRNAVEGYEIVAELGRGGMGVVYKANQVGLNRPVALKMVLAGVHAGVEALARFRIEAEAVAALQHPNVVQVYDVGEVRQQSGDVIPYMVLEYLEGGTLSEKLNGTPLPPRPAARLVEALAHAVHAAHLRGIIHRDLKPTNILLTLDGTPKVSDFGLAKQINAGSSAQTVTGAVMGTPSYMAPEQAEGRTRDIGPATDVYALGTILYEIITGRPPFRAPAPLDTLKLVTSADPVPPSRLEPKLPRDLETICLKCLQKKTGDRYGSAELLAEDLHHFLANEPISARPVPPWERAVKWVKRRPAEAALITLAGALLLSLVGGSFWYHHTQQLEAAYAETELRREEAEKNQREAVQRLVRLDVSNGMRAVDDGDPMGGLLWLVEALRQLGEDEQATVHRQRLAAVLDACPKVQHILFHKDRVATAAFDPTGQRLLTVSQQAQIWDLKDKQHSTLVLAHPGMVETAAFSPDGSWVVTGGADGSARIWSAANGAAHAPPMQHAGSVVRVHFSSDGRRLLTASRDGTARVWDVAGGAVSLPLEHRGPVVDAAFSPDGRQVATASEDNTARVWDAGTGQAISPVVKHGGVVNSVVFRPDGRAILTASADRTARMWDATTGQEMSPALQHTDGVVSASFSPDGQRVVTAGLDNVACIWAMPSGHLLTAPLQHADAIMSARFNADGLRIATTSEDNLARIWDAHTGQPLSPDLRHNGTVYDAVFGPLGDRVVTASQDGTARVWDTVPLPRPDRPSQPSQTGLLSWTSSDGKYVASEEGELTLRVRRSRGESAAVRIHLGGRLYHVAFSPDNQRLVTACDDRTAQVWDTVTGESVSPPLKHGSKVYHASFSVDGVLVGTASDDNTARVWNATSGQPITPSLMHHGSVYHASFSKDSTLLLTSARDGTARVWDLVSAEPVTPPLPYRDWVKRVLEAKGDDRNWALPTVDRSLTNLQDLAMAYSGQHVDDAGAPVPLGAAEFRKIWENLDDRNLPRPKPRDWHRHEADHARSHRDWFGVIWNLQRLVHLEPNNAAWKKELVEARRQHAAALGDVDKSKPKK
jgi:WD40 repeat protein/serine/threonine protein kinase